MEMLRLESCIEETEEKIHELEQQKLYLEMHLKTNQQKLKEI